VNDGEDVSYSTGPQWSPTGSPPDNMSDADHLAQARARGQDLIGLPLDDAVAVAMTHGFSIRLAREDGADFILSMDLNVRRINLEVVDGRVFSASAG
jgi:hypothetical protein